MNNTIQISYIRAEDVPALVAALQARDTYLKGLIGRQLNYRHTSTRNRKLEALEAEQEAVERLLGHALSAQYDLDKMKPISPTRTAPAPTKSDYFKILQK